MNVQFSPSSDLDFEIEGLPPRLDILPDEELGTLQLHLEEIASSGLDPRHQAAAALVIVIRALRGKGLPTDVILQAFERWLAADWIHGSIDLFLERQAPRLLADFLLWRVVRSPSALANIVGAARILSGDLKSQVFESIANDGRDDVRLHLYQLLTEHRRLDPPGTLPAIGPAELEAALIRHGLFDPNADVRERAVSFATGRGKVLDVRERMIELTDDPAPNVRAYALLALGTLGDAATLQLLRSRLSGTVEDATSAIWALARRPDGLPYVLALLPDRREWVVNEVLGALARVSAPLTDEQIAELQQTVEHPWLETCFQRHLWRTRDPQGREYGPDMEITYTKNDNDD